MAGSSQGRSVPSQDTKSRRPAGAKWTASPNAAGGRGGGVRAQTAQRHVTSALANASARVRALRRGRLPIARTRRVMVNKAARDPAYASPCRLSGRRRSRVSSRFHQAAQVTTRPTGIISHRQSPTLKPFTAPRYGTTRDANSAKANRLPPIQRAPQLVHATNATSSLTRGGDTSGHRRSWRGASAAPANAPATMLWPRRRR